MNNTAELNAHTDFIDMSSYELYTTEYNLIFYYFNSEEYDVPQETYEDVQTAILKAREFLKEDKNMRTVELWLQTTGWMDGVPETVGDSLIGVINKNEV